MIQRLGAAVLGTRIPVPNGIPPAAVPGTVTLRSGRLVPWLGGVLARMEGPAAAVTLGRTIIVQPGARLTPALLAHELAHVRQWEQVPFFPIRYALATLRHGYYDNPFEVEARRFASASIDQPDQTAS